MRKRRVALYSDLVQLLLTGRALFKRLHVYISVLHRKGRSSHHPLYGNTNRIASIVVKSPENYLFAVEISYKEQAVCSVFSPEMFVCSQAGLRKREPENRVNCLNRHVAPKRKRKTNPFMKRCSLSILQTGLSDSPAPQPRAQHAPWAGRWLRSDVRALSSAAGARRGHRGSPRAEPSRSRQRSAAQVLLRHRRPPRTAALLCPLRAPTAARALPSRPWLTINASGSPLRGRPFVVALESQTQLRQINFGSEARRRRQPPRGSSAPRRPRPRPPPPPPRRAQPDGHRGPPDAAPARRGEALPGGDLPGAEPPAAPRRQPPSACGRDPDSPRPRRLPRGRAPPRCAPRPHPPPLTSGRGHRRASPAAGPGAVRSALRNAAPPRRGEGRREAGAGRGEARPGR